MQQKQKVMSQSWRTDKRANEQLELNLQDPPSRAGIPKTK